jgi:hypothetical protein
MTKRVPTTVRRFNEGKGERFMLDGETVRCQCRSKSKVLKHCPPGVDKNVFLKSLDREAYWPEAQCPLPVEPNTFMCNKHGGRSPSALQNKKDLLDFLPGYMAEKIRMLQARPDLLDRSFEIQQLRARNLELHERMKNAEALPGSVRVELWRALKLIEKGDVVRGTERAKAALSHVDDEEASFDEIRTNIVLMKDLTRTHVATAKDLQQIVTFDQFLGTLVSIADIVARAVAKYITDRRAGELFIADVQSGIAGLINARLAGVQPSLAEQNYREPGTSV